MCDIMVYIFAKLCLKSVHAKHLAVGLDMNIYTLGLVISFLLFIKATEIAIGIFLIVFVIQFICSVLLIVGTEKNRHRLLVPWLIFAVVGQVALLGLIIWGMVNNKRLETLPLWIAFLVNPCNICHILALYEKIRTIREEEPSANLGNLESGNLVQTKESSPA